MGFFPLTKGENGETIEYNARYVAKDFKQVFVNDYLEASAPTANLSSIRIGSAFATRFHCKFYQIGVSSRFLNANLEDGVHVRQLPGSDLSDKIRN